MPRRQTSFARDQKREGKDDRKVSFEKEREIAGSVRNLVERIEVKAKAEASEARARAKSQAKAPKEKAKAKAKARARSAEITGISINKSQDIKFWKEQSANEIRAQFKFRDLEKYNKFYAFKTKEDLLEILKELIQTKQW